MANLKTLVFSLVLLILASACEDVRMHSFQSLQGDWSRFDTLEYACYAPEGRDEAFVVDVQLRCEASYPYRELWLGVQCRADSVEYLSTDTLRCEIFDSLGRHNGTTGGVLYQTSHRLGVLEFPKADTVRVRLYHLMDGESVEGVTDVGIKVTALSRRRFSEN